MGQELTIVVDVAVLGAGTAGCLVARKLVTSTAANVLLVEAGPDHGPFDGDGWPAELIDSMTLPTSHDWGYEGPGADGEPSWSFERARILGGCSSHNGCSQTVGVGADYETWGLGWNRAEIEARLASLTRALRVRKYRDDELTPFQQGVMDAMVQRGIPRTDDLDVLDGGVGCGPSPVNSPRGVRWNSGFAFLDEVRSEPRLRVLGDAVVDRLDVEGTTVRKATVRIGADVLIVEAQHFVLCAGAYGSPEILLRSGVGPASELAALDIVTAVDLPGVGRNLHDHPTLELRFAASELLAKRTKAFAASRPAPDEQVIAKVDSLLGDGPYDMHIFPWTDPPSARPECVLPVASLAPRSRGSVVLRSVDPDVRPLVDHAYLRDDAGHDRAVLMQGLKLCEELSTARALAPLLGDPVVASGRRHRLAHYWHPVGTCAIGKAPEEGAVVDSDGRVFGVDNLRVIDAAAIPVVPRATTNLPVLLLADHLADRLVMTLTATAALGQTR